MPVMTARHPWIVPGTALILALALAACTPSGPLEISAIQVGRRLNSDNSVAEHTTAFRPNDTIYVAVLTTGPGRGTIGVRWLFAGRLISEPEQAVVYRDQAATEFHIQNSGGFPPGDYRVEVFLDGAPAGERNFRVGA
jgi:hypothetical protein